MILHSLKLRLGLANALPIALSVAITAVYSVREVQARTVCTDSLPSKLVNDAATSAAFTQTS